jgi:hypothetical protein
MDMTAPLASPEEVLRRWRAGGNVLRLLGGLLLGLVMAGCMKLGIQTEGVSGPLAWRATDRKVQAVTGDTGVIMGREGRDVYACPLLLHETQGTAITFTQLAATMTATASLTPVALEQDIQWRLRPHGTLRRPLASTYQCLGSECINPGPIAPVWHLRLTGVDDQGQPVRVVIHVRLPANPEAIPQR